jgi:hypothetical protein
MLVLLVLVMAAAAVVVARRHSITEVQALGLLRTLPVQSTNNTAIAAATAKKRRGGRTATALHQQLQHCPYHHQHHTLSRIKMNGL